MDLSSTSFNRSTLSKSSKSRKTKNRLAGGPSLLDSKLTASSKMRGPVSTTVSGPINAGNITVIVNGIDFTPLPLSPEETQTHPQTQTQVESVKKVTSEMSSSSSSSSSAGFAIKEGNEGKVREVVEEKRFDDSKAKEKEREKSEGKHKGKNLCVGEKLNLEEEVIVSLQETCTCTVFHVEGTCVEAGTQEHKRVAAVNHAYEALQKEKETSDMFAPKSTQTLNEEVKHKEVSATVSATVESGCQANSWEIYDMENKLQALQEGLEQDEDHHPAGRSQAVADKAGAAVLRQIVKARLKQVDVIVGCLMNQPGCLLSVEGEEKVTTATPTATPTAAPTATNDPKSDSKTAEPDAIGDILKVAERSIQQNVYHDKFRSYRGIPSTVEEPASSDIELEHLWSFQCEETRGHGVASISWNVVNKDLVAVSYCAFEFCAQIEDSPGLILLWTLKNPEYPERVIRSSCGVSCVAFSRVHPNLLGAGLYDGTIAIYDLSLESNLPAVDSTQAATQHKDAVWQVKWIDRGEKGEILVSMSTDGRVMEWSLKKGISSKEIMLMKRISVPPHLGGGAEGLISRTASGMCFDFALDDPHTYFAGTEDGTIHKCSSSYNEQYLSTYLGHTGPVYKLKSSPFNKNILLSCSADWSAKLWDVSQETPLLTMQSVDMAAVVTDVFWSPTHATVFALCAEDGRIELWDLSRNSLDPVVTHFTDRTCSPPKTEETRVSTSPRKTLQPQTARNEDEPEENEKEAEGIERRVRYSAIAFAGDLPILVAGNGLGEVEVFRVHGLGDTNSKAPVNVQEQQEIFREVLSRELK